MSNDLAEAWFAKHQKIDEQLEKMEQGFALFRPEAVERVRKDRDHAADMVRFWNSQP